VGRPMEGKLVPLIGIARLDPQFAIGDIDLIAGQQHIGIPALLFQGFVVGVTPDCVKVRYPKSLAMLDQPSGSYIT